MYERHCNRPDATSRAGADSTPKLPLTPVDVIEQHEVALLPVTVEEFWTDNPHADYYVVGWRQ